MPIAAERPDLAEAIEALLLYGLAPSASLRYLRTEGATVIMGASPDANANRVGLVKVGAEAADELLDQTLRVYAEAGHGSTWYVSPTTRPADLGQRLLARGLRRDAATDLAGMALTPLNDGPPPPTGSELRCVDLAEMRANVHVIAEGFGTDLAAPKAMLDMYAQGTAPGFEFVYYLAFEQGRAVGHGTSLVDHRRRVTLLGGSAVLPAHRGRGHYRALVNARLADARRRGSLAMVSQAVRSTSAPILAQMGFEELLAIEKYEMAAP